VKDWDMSYDIQAADRPKSPVLPNQRGARDELLRSTVHFGRLMFDAYACSIFLYRAADDALVLEATSEQLEDRLLTIEVPAHSGVVGWVFQSGEAMAFDDLDHTPQFDRATAEATGHVPASMLVAPLALNGQVFGALEILDPGEQVRADMKTLDLVEELARQCCASLAALGHLPAMTAAGAGDDELGRLVEKIYRLAGDGSDRAAGLVSALRAVVQMMGADDD
jgi:signal transduction protein with GAF and PtsI domain